MSQFSDLPESSADWVELTSHLLGNGRGSPRTRHPGVEVHSADLTMLCSALEEHIKTSTASTVPVSFLPSEPFKDSNPALPPELCFSQFGEWPSRPDVSGPCSLLLSTGPNSVGQCSADATPPNSLDESCLGKPEDDEETSKRPWRLRHSSIFQWRFVGWFLRNFPTVFRHFASFLLGAAAMLLLLKKRVKLPFVPLE
uniref:BNIP3L n=1 Tax=Mesocestoides corti TaxID=53468 RepID=A0A5K3EZM5_MESCO